MMEQSPWLVCQGDYHTYHSIYRSPFSLFNVANTSKLCCACYTSSSIVNTGSHHAAYTINGALTNQQTLLLTTPSIPEMVLPNGITVYRAAESKTVCELSAIVEAFPDLWKDSGKFVDLPK